MGTPITGHCNALAARRLLHGGLYGGIAIHPDGILRGGAYRRRRCLAAVPPRHAATAEASDLPAADPQRDILLPRIRPDLRDDRGRTGVFHYHAGAIRIPRRLR